MPRLLCAAVLAAAAASGLAGAQPPSTEATFTGCLQRAPSNMATDGRFMLTNASNSPLGGGETDSTTPAAPAPARGTEPIESRPGQSDTRQQTGGVDYLLQGGTNLESMIGQRVEVVGSLDGRIRVPPTLPTTKRPVEKLKVKRMRTIAPNCGTP